MSITQEYSPAKKVKQKGGKNQSAVNISDQKLIIKMHGQIFHILCCAHILNLIVKEGMNVISDGIVKKS